jgi:hypothetical protein
MIYLDGVTNVRDIGGCTTRYAQTVRQGLFYRSSEFSPHHVITPYGIQQILALGIVMEIDLRNDGEAPVPMLPAEIRYYRPMYPSGGLESYWYGLSNYSTQYADVFHELAKRENYPLICHCWAGADRAGTVAALLEAVLGFSYSQIVLDYQWTSLSVNGARDTSSYNWKQMVDSLKSFGTSGNSFESGVIEYLVSIGVTMDEIQSVRDIFLEGEPQPPSVKYFGHGRIVVAAKHTVRLVLSDGTYSVRSGCFAAGTEIFDLRGKRIMRYNEEYTGAGYIRGAGVFVAVVP